MGSRKRPNGVARKVGQNRRDAPKPWNLHCFCKQDKLDSWVVSCANCGKWYHGKCISLSPNLKERIDQLYCRRCEINYGLVSSFHSKCRLKLCERAARDNGEFCSTEHREEFWKSTMQQIEASPVKNVQILRWLANRCGEDHSSFAVATPRTLPKPPKPQNAALESQLERLNDAINYRETNNVCGFDEALLESLNRPTPASTTTVTLPSESSNGVMQDRKCMGDIKTCGIHKNWPEMMKKRMMLGSDTEDERREPDPAWLVKRAKYLVAGTTRYSRRKGWKAAYFIPYIWEDDDQDFFLDNNPEPFWDRHF